MPVSPPRPRDLPLTALRAFEAAARLGGFAAAGAELGVSPGAITAHVKALEAALGGALFERNARGVALTAAGARVLPAFTQAFDGLGLAVQDLRREVAPRQVHVATLPAIAQLWLSPRLPALRAAAPDIAVSITAMERPPNLKRAPYDLSLFYDENPAGRLTADVILPVCAPSLAKGLRTPEDLASVACLSDASWGDDWAVWAAAAGVSAFVPRGPVFSLYALAVEETINGAGVLIGHGALVEAGLRRGLLVAPFDLAVTLPRCLRLWSDRRIDPASAVGRVAAFLRASVSG